MSKECDTFEQCKDAISVASQLGRLDFVSALLAIIGVALVLGGLFTFLHFRNVAKEEACKEAERHAKIVAERVANEYLQAELPALLEEYRRFMEAQNGNNVDNDDDFADEIADSQEE